MSADADKAVFAPSGTALYLTATSGSYDAATDTFTELSSNGTYDLASDADVARTGVQRKRTTHVRHKDGVSYIVGSVVHAYAWHERQETQTWVSIEDVRTLELAGYGSAGNPQYTGTVTYCTRGMNYVNLVGTTSPIASVAVYDVSVAGVSTQRQQYTAASCPFTYAQFDTIAPAVKPSTMRMDWVTRKPR